MSPKLLPLEYPLYALRHLQTRTAVLQRGLLIRAARGGLRLTQEGIDFILKEQKHLFLILCWLKVLLLYSIDWVIQRIDEDQKLSENALSELIVLELK
jgi:hypothetical protein